MSALLAVVASAGRGTEPPHRVEGAITVHSLGGLGNQLFVYGAGLAAARAAGARLRIDVGQHAERDDRPPLLEDLGFPGEYVVLAYEAPAEEPLTSKIRRKVSGKLPLVEPVGVRHNCTWREAGFPFDPRALQQPSGSCLFGYFQSWRYVAPVADEMRGLLESLFAARRKRLEAVAEAIATSRGIVVHVRRGDYLVPQARDFHGLAGVSFYAGALGALRRMGFDGPLFVFSDDVDAAEKELAPLGDVAPLDRGSYDAVDELLLMSRAPALVTANSSFSWWAGWIGDHDARPVVSPRPWFDQAGLDDRDIVPPHWLTLGRRTP